MGGAPARRAPAGRVRSRGVMWTGKFGRSPASSVTVVAASAAAALRSAVSLSEVSWRMASSMSPHFSRMEDTSCGFDARNGAVSV